jgi:hypothetical protein
MTVYLVYEHDYDASRVEALFDSRYKAEQYVRDQEER